MALFSPRPLLAAHPGESADRRARYAAAQKAGPVRVDGEALYFRGFPAPVYLPLSCILRAYCRRHECTASGDLDMDATYYGLVAEYEGGEKEALFSYEKDVTAALELLKSRGVAVGSPARTRAGRR